MALVLDCMETTNFPTAHSQHRQNTSRVSCVLFLCCRTELVGKNLRKGTYVPDSVNTTRVIIFCDSCQPTIGTWRASADNARLYFEDDQDNKRIGSWCAADRENQWLQVDLRKTKKIRAIATQGN